LAYASILRVGTSDESGFSWNAFQVTVASTPDWASAASRLRFPIQQNGQMMSLIMSMATLRAAMSTVRETPLPGVYTCKNVPRPLEGVVCLQVRTSGISFPST
jgi:hypothetical protein